MRIYTGVTVDTEDANLTALGYSGTINDKQFAALRAEGLLGALPDMFKQFDGDLAGAPTAYTARFGVGADNALGTGAFDTSLYTGSTPANGTYGNFEVLSGVITPNGSQTAGTYDVGGWPVEVISGYKAVKTQAEFDALTPANAGGKTVLVREAAAITAGTGWNNNLDMGWATILGDGDDPRGDVSSGRDSRKHFVSWNTLNTKKLILDRLRVVTNSTAGTKVNGITMDDSGGGNFVADIHILRCAIIVSRPGPFDDYSGGISTYPGGLGIEMRGAAVRCSVRDNYVFGASGATGAIDVGVVTGYCEVIGNHIDVFYQDGIRGSGAEGTLLGGNLLTRPMADGGDTGLPHSDGTQFLGAKAVVEASAYIAGYNLSRGNWQSLYTKDATGTMLVRNVLVSDETLYQISIFDPEGCSIQNCTWLPVADTSFPLPGSTQGGLRFQLSANPGLLGTNDILNSIYRETASNIETGVTRTGNVNSQSWVEADWDTNFPNWQINSIPTLQNALQVHAAGASAAAGKGADQGLTFGSSERSSYSLSVTTPTISNITLMATSDGFTGTLRTDVGNNNVYWAIIPQADPNPTWREIKEQRVSGAVGYGQVWCSRANAGTDLAISNNTSSPSTAYKLCVVAENGWSKQSSITTANFTTTAAGISLVAVGPVASSNSTATITMTVPGGISNGDYLVAIISHRQTSSEPTTPAWGTLIGNGVGFTSGSATIAVYGREVDGTEGATLAVTTAAAARMIGFIAVYRGVDAAGTNAAGGEATNAANTVATHATPTLTATADSCILHIWATTLTTTITLPNPADLVASGYTPDAAWFLGAENLLSTSAGTTAARTASSSSTDRFNGMQVELLKA